MQKLRFFALALSLIFMFVLVMILSIPYTTIAQDADVGTPPLALTPGVPIDLQRGLVVPTLSYSSCYAPLALRLNELIYIKPQVNIRAAANGSSAIVWNTSYNQINDLGTPLPPAEQFNVEAFVVAGPVCVMGYNWWQVNVSGGNGGWVSEGRPTEGYLLLVPGIDFSLNCQAIYGLVAGEVATLTQNARVRESANTDSRVRTVAPVGSQVTVLRGPECDRRTGTIWFEVEVVVVDFTYRGWMAQGQGGAVWLIPNDLPSEEAGTLCGAPLDLPVGGRAYVNTFDEQPRYLRQSPGLDGAVAFLLVDGVPFEITGGPTCVDNINWWPIRVLSSFPVSGWISEGSRGSGYWLSPHDPDEFAH